jgi:phosphoribosylglycinamide formyltransferase-1
MFRVGWFSSGRDQAAIDLFTGVADRIDRGLIPGRIAYVFCDREPGESEASDRFLDAVRGRGIPLVTNSSNKLRALIKAKVPELGAFRETFEAQIIGQIRNFAAEVVVMAGYRLIVSPRLCEAFLCLNLHPAVPGGPAGTWQEVMWQLMADDAKEAGAMMHLATPMLDAGPPVTYFCFPLTGEEFEPLWADFNRKRGEQSFAEIQAKEGKGEPLFVKIRQEELRRESPLILLTVKNLANGHLTLSRLGVHFEDRLLPQGVDLSEEVEDFLKHEAGRNIA